MTIGERIAKRREELGYTQEELAKKWDIPGSQLYPKQKTKRMILS